jgi:hypothetical protein
MTQTLFIVYFKNGIQDHWHASSAIEAGILAMAAAIKSGRDFSIDFVENTETKEKCHISLSVDNVAKL